MSNDVHKFADDIPVVRQASILEGNNVTFKGSPVTNSTKLVMGTISRVFYQHNTCDVILDDSGILLKSDEGYDNGSISVPLPCDFYGYNDQNQPFVRPRLVKEGMRVLVGFINGETSHPIVIGVYPDDNNSYELISPNNFNEISDYNKDIQDDVMNLREITPAQTIIYQAGNGNFARSMQGHSFALVDDNTNGYLDKIDLAYEDLKYFQKKNPQTGNYESIEAEDETAPAWLLVHESNDSDTHITRFYVNKQGEFQVLFFDRFDFKNLVILNGSKDNGFTVTRQFDTNGLDDDSKDYVTFNVGKDKSISMVASSPKDSKEQSSSLTVKSDGIYLNGALLFNNDNANNGDDSGLLDNMANGTTGNKNWDDFQKSVIEAAKQAQEAADEAKQAGEQAKQAGLDAEAAGQKAETLAKDTQNKIAYYLSISDNADVYVPQKYLIIDTNTFIKDGTIQSAHIQDAAITSANIRDAAITNAKIADLAVNRAQIGYGAIGTAQIEDLAVTDEKVGKLSFNHMIGNTLDASKINVTNLNGQNIKADTIEAGKLKIDNLGDITSQLGNVGNGTIKGSDIVGSTMHLADSYDNLFYDKQMSRAQYDNYGFTTGYTFNGPRINTIDSMTHCAGVREHANQYLAIYMSRSGYYDNNGGWHDSSIDISSGKNIILLAVNEPLHIHLSSGPSNIFNNGGTRRIVFYDRYGNVTGHYEISSSNDFSCTPPDNSVMFSISIYVGTNGASTWANNIAVGKFTQHDDYLEMENSIIAWQGNSNDPGYSCVPFEYGGTDGTRYGEGRDTDYIRYLTLDTSQLNDGDTILLNLDINYDNELSRKGSRLYMMINGLSEEDSSKYLFNDNEQYAIVGNYKYTWYFVYRKELGNTVTFDIAMRNQFYGSRWYITDSNEIIHPTNGNYQDYGFYGSKITSDGAMNTISPQGEIRQTYHNLQSDPHPANNKLSAQNVTHLRDIQMYHGYITFQSQNVSSSMDNGNTLHTDYDDFSAVYLSGSGLSFAGDFNKNYVEPFMYNGHLNSTSSGGSNAGAVLTFWGNMSHEQLTEHDFDFVLGSGMSFDVWGNIHLMYSSVSWNVVACTGKTMYTLDQTTNNFSVGNSYAANVPGTTTLSYQDGTNHPVEFNGSNGNLTIGRLRMSTLGGENQQGSNVDFHLIKDGTFNFHGSVNSSDSTFHTVSNIADKYDISLLDTNKSVMAIQNTDFAQFHLKKHSDRVDGYQKGVVIDKGTDYSVDPSFIDDNGNSLNLMNLIATLGDVVKKQQKQISDLNAKVAYLTIKE